MGKHFRIEKKEDGTFEYLCNYCDFKTDSKGAMLRHHNPKDPNRCKEKDWKTEELEKEKDEKPTFERQEIDPSLSSREIVAQHGIEGLHYLGRRLLQGFLKDAPSVADKTYNWIMNLWDADDGIRGDPNQLHRALMDAGVKHNIAWRISSAVNNLYTQHSSTLQNTQQPTFFGYGQGYPQNVPSQFFNPLRSPLNPSVPFNPYNPQPPQSKPGYYSKEEVDRMLAEKDKEKKIETIAASLDELKKSIPEMIKEGRESNISGNFETITIPIDEKGNPCKPENAVSEMKRRRPVLVNKEEDFLGKMLKYKELFSQKGITADEIEKIIEKSQGVSSPQIEKLEKALEEQQKEYQKLKSDMNAKEREKMEASIQGLNQDIKNLKGQVTSSGVNSPEAVIATGITSIADRHPMDSLVGLGRELFTTGKNIRSQPENSKKALPGVRNPIIDGLKKKGFVTTIREKVRGAGVAA